MQFKKLALPILLGTTLLATQVAYGLSFSDVKSSDWYASTVNKLVDKGGVKGYADGTFKPNGTITRAEFVTMTVRSMGHTPDVVTGSGVHWSAGAFQKAREIGLLQNNELNTGMDNPITRYDMALVASRALEVNKETIPSNYLEYGPALSDYKSAPSQYKDDMVRAYATGMITGYPDKTFGGSKTLTRAEASTVVMRIIDSSTRVAAVKPSSQGAIALGETKPIAEILTEANKEFADQMYSYQTITLVDGKQFNFRIEQLLDGKYDGLRCNGKHGILIFVKDNKIVGKINNTWDLETSETIYNPIIGSAWDTADYYAFKYPKQIDMKLFVNPFKKN